MDAPVRVSATHERRYRGARKAATECVINLLRAADLVSTDLNKHLRAFGLSGATFNVLMILEGDAQPLCPADIGDRLLVTRGTVTGLLDSLEKQALVRRTPHPQDRRMLLIEITPKARALLKDVWAEHFPMEVRLMSGLSEREQEQLIKLLGKIQAHLLPPATD